MKEAMNVVKKKKYLRINLYVRNFKEYKLWKKLVESKGIKVSNRLQVLIENDLKHFIAEIELLKRMGKGRNTSKVQSSKISSKKSPPLPSPNSQSLKFKQGE